jgi:bidirectional [NiFe] hydrogenase diaphorase subunit
MPYQKVRTTPNPSQIPADDFGTLFSERNHMCGVCVANNHCELQTLAVKTGSIISATPFFSPRWAMDASHKDFVLDQNRCILCTRCVRVCDEIETAHVWDIMGRGVQSRLICGF